MHLKIREQCHAGVAAAVLERCIRWIGVELLGGRQAAAAAHGQLCRQVFGKAGLCCVVLHLLHCLHLATT
jgi:hypothetical protein